MSSTLCYKVKRRPNFGVDQSASLAQPFRDVRARNEMQFDPLLWFPAAAHGSGAIELTCSRYDARRGRTLGEELDVTHATKPDSSSSSPSAPDRLHRHRRRDTAQTSITRAFTGLRTCSLITPPSSSVRAIPATASFPLLPLGERPGVAREARDLLSFEDRFHVHA